VMQLYTTRVLAVYDAEFVAAACVDCSERRGLIVVENWAEMHENAGLTGVCPRPSRDMVGEGFERFEVERIVTEMKYGKEMNKELFSSAVVTVEVGKVEIVR
jgi:hypothetical protein